MQNSSDWNANNNVYHNVSVQLSNIFNESISDIPTWGVLFDNLGARYCHGHAYPPGITDDMVQLIYDAIVWEYQYSWLNAEVASLGSGSLLQEIYERMENNLAGEKSPKLVFYSGHDATVGPLMGSLGVFLGWPPYASHIEIELWNSNNNNDTFPYFVQVKYNGEVYQIQGCDSVFCPYNQFEEAIANIIPSSFSQFAEECVIPSANDKTNDNNNKNFRFN